MNCLKQAIIEWTIKVDGLSVEKNMCVQTFGGSFDGIGETLVRGFNITEFFLQVLALLFAILIGCLNTA